MSLALVNFGDQYWSLSIFKITEIQSTDVQDHYI